MVLARLPKKQYVLDNIKDNIMQVREVPRVSKRSVNWRYIYNIFTVDDKRCRNDFL